MSAAIIDGKAFAEGVRARVKQEAARLKIDHDLTPGLAVVLVGEDPASQVYVRSKRKQAIEAGFNSIEHTLAADTSQDALLALIADLNADPAVHGILVQLPVPDHIDQEAVIQAIDPRKDVDGFHLLNVGRLASGMDGQVPCTPLGCLMMLKDRLGDLSGLHAVVIGRSHMVGKPMGHLLLNANCTVTWVHSRTPNPAEITRQADIVVAAVGRPLMVTADWIKPGATVIDVGINRVDAPEKGAGKTRLVGDVDFEAVKQVAGAITPVPGGVGPMTVACLLRNALVSACALEDVAAPDNL